MIEVLRLGHRIIRDKRISTHVSLVARSFGANRLSYSGQRDRKMEEGVFKVVNDFGGNFSIDYIGDYIRFIKDKKEKGYIIAHLTIYGESINDVGNIVKKNKNVLFIVGGKKVPKEVYGLADYNISVSLQPHSEVAALAICLYDYFGKNILMKTFKNPNLKIIPKRRGKEIKKLK